MRKASRQSALAIAAALAAGGVVCWAGSQGGVRVEALGGLSLFALCGALAFAVNGVAFVPSYLAQSERAFDLVGSLTYLLVVGLGCALGARGDPRSLLLGGLIASWALRLGSFLFRRILRDGSDGRFDAIKPDPLRFATTWTLQGLWVVLTAGCALAAITADEKVPLGGLAVLGTALWLAGFAVEVAADSQKRRFREDPGNRGRFITTGLWAWSRHPNYFGEILLWVGIALVALPALSGARYATLVSPLFVYVLLTRISGIPLLERRAARRWGDEPAYRDYVERTPLLVPRPPRAAA